MLNVISALFQRLGLGNKAKALVPAIAGLLGVLVNYLVTGQLDNVSLDSAVSGFVTAALVYIVPNKSTAPAPLAQALTQIDNTYAPSHAGAPSEVKN